jgi:hypothetical protein
MRIRTALAAALAVGAFVWVLKPSDPGIDPMTSASVAPVERREFTISNMENGTACLVAKGRQLTSHSRALSIDDNCDTVWPGLQQASNWTQNEDGTVVLTDPSGSAILTLAIGDGVDYEALEPSNAVLAVTAVN